MLYSYRIEQAIRAAAVLHRTQTRKGSAPFPYITHPFAVALIVSDYTEDEDTVITALLHDTIEDTDYTFEELEEDFGENVRNMVAGLTEVSTDAQGEKLPWKERKQQYLAALKNAPAQALIVAAADKIHNMRAMIEEYYEAKQRFIQDFGGTLNERLMAYQNISNVLNRRLENDIIHEFNHVFTEYKNFIDECRKQV